MSELSQIVLYFFLPALILTYTAAFLINRRNQSDLIRAPRQHTPDGTYQAMRHMLLTGLQDKGIDLPARANPEEPYVVLMDWPVSKAIATVVAVADGAASIYYSTGEGVLGGGNSDDKIRQAAIHAIAIASEFRAQMLPTKEFPLPDRGTTYFYAVSDAGVFTASAPTKELKNHTHALSKLGDAMQAIITKYRMRRTKS